MKITIELEIEFGQQHPYQATIASQDTTAEMSAVTLRELLPQMEAGLADILVGTGDFEIRSVPPFDVVPKPELSTS